MPAFDPRNPNFSKPPESVPASGAESGSLTDSRLFEMTQDQSEQELDRARRRSASPPAEVPGYEFEGFLGAGAYGSVWKALQKSTGKRVAIKFYEHRGGLDWSFLSREVEKLAFLYTDRDVVQLIDVGWDASPPYYIMEYLERGSLDQLMARGRVPVEEAVRIVREVGQALVHAHGRGILHCDLKPANVLLDNDWKIRLADFGQSRLSHEQVPALGTLFYMAPEQADLKASPDARWDVYALGALLFHLLTGSPPHRTDDVEARLKKAPKLADRLAVYQKTIKSAPTPTAHRRLRGVDRSLAEVVERCLEADPARRYPNAQAVIEAMDRRSHHRARRPLMWLGGVAPMVLLGGAFALGYLGWSKTVRESEQTLVSAVQASNKFAARGAASTVELTFSELRNDVGEAANALAANTLLLKFLRDHHDPQLDEKTLSELKNDKFHVAKEFVTKVSAQFADEPFETWVIFNRSGTFLARSPAQSRLVGVNFHWRDYYRSLIRQVEDVEDDGTNFVYISRVFQSKAVEAYYMFGMSTPVYDANGFVGVLMATIKANSLPLGLDDDRRRTSVLVGRWDDNLQPTPSQNGTASERDTGADEGSGEVPDYRIFVHPMYPQGEGPAVQAVLINKEQRALIEGLPEAPPNGGHSAVNGVYVDPVAKQFAEESGDWLAGLSPVHDTPFIISVQQQYEDAIRPVKDLTNDLAWLGLQALGLGIVLLGGAWYFVQRAMQQENPQVFWAAADPTDTSPSVTETWSSATGSGGTTRRSEPVEDEE